MNVQADNIETLAGVIGTEAEDAVLEAVKTALERLRGDGSGSGQAGFANGLYEATSQLAYIAVKYYCATNNQDCSGSASEYFDIVVNNTEGSQTATIYYCNRGYDGSYNRSNGSYCDGSRATEVSYTLDYDTIAELENITYELNSSSDFTWSAEGDSNIGIYSAIFNDTADLYEAACEDLNTYLEAWLIDTGSEEFTLNDATTRINNPESYVSCTVGGETGRTNIEDVTNFATFVYDIYTMLSNIKLANLTATGATHDGLDNDGNLSTVITRVSIAVGGFRSALYNNNLGNYVLALNNLDSSSYNNGLFNSELVDSTTDFDTILENTLEAIENAVENTVVSEEGVHNIYYFITEFIDRFDVEHEYDEATKTTNYAYLYNETEDTSYQFTDLGSVGTLPDNANGNNEATLYGDLAKSFVGAGLTSGWLNSDAGFTEGYADIVLSGAQSDVITTLLEYGIIETAEDDESVEEDI